MKSIFKRALLFIAAAMTMGGAVATIASAQQDQGPANGFRISPVRSELTIEKGKNESITVTVENPTDIATVAKPIVNDFVASDKENGEPRLILDENAPSPKNSFKKLVGTIPDLELGPKQRKDVNVTISIPADAAAGGYYGAIRFAPSAAGQQSTVGLTASVGTVVLVRVPGNLTERLDLVQIGAAQNGKIGSFFTKGTVTSVIRLKNSGDIHVQPFGKVLIKNMTGKLVYEYELNNKTPRDNILPESTRRFEDELKSKKLFGRYTIEANLGYSQGSGDLISAKTSFWYVPTWALIALLVILAAGAGGVYWLLKRRANSTRHKSKK